MPYRSARKLNLKAKRRHALREPSNKPEIHLSPTPTLSLSHYYFASFVRLIHSPQLSSNWETREYERSCLRCTVNLYGVMLRCCFFFPQVLLYILVFVVDSECTKYTTAKASDCCGKTEVHTYICMYVHAYNDEGCG